jgi:NADH-quinone oxidoreductase subunit M
MLWLYKRIIFGEIVNEDLKSMLDLKRFEILILFSLVIPIIFFGFYPEPLMNSIETSVENVLDMYNLNITNNLAYKN